MQRNRQRFFYKFFQKRMKNPAIFICSNGTQCPNRPALTIFRTFCFQPFAVIGHEIPEFSRFFIEGMIYKRSEEHTSELQSRENLVCRLLLEKKKSVGAISKTRIRK